jgi:hypothetical protein
MKFKMLDYKFLLIIIISMALYFLYRRIENLESKLKQIENKDTELKPIELPLPEDNEEFQLPLPEPETSGIETPQQNNESFDTITFPFNSHQTIVNNNESPYTVPEVAVETVPEDNHIVEQNVEQIVEQVVQSEDVEIVDVNIDLKFVEVDNMINDFQENNIEEYSNEESEVQIYSNDNEEEHHSSLMESMVEAVDESPEDKDKLNELLKNKLPELQEIAEQLKINIHKENSKKKTKLELATEILHSEK